MLWHHAVAHCTAAARRVGAHSPGGRRRLEMGRRPGRHALCGSTRARRGTGRYQGAVVFGTASPCHNCAGGTDSNARRSGLSYVGGLAAFSRRNHCQHRRSRTSSGADRSCTSTSPHVRRLSGWQESGRVGARSARCGTSERAKGHTRGRRSRLRRHRQSSAAEFPSRVLCPAGIGGAASRRADFASSSQTLKFSARCAAHRVGTAAPLTSGPVSACSR